MIWRVFRFAVGISAAVLFMTGGVAWLLVKFFGPLTLLPALLIAWLWAVACGAVILVIVEWIDKRGWL